MKKIILLAALVVASTALYAAPSKKKKKEVAEFVKSRIAERMAQIKAGEINESYEMIG